jgi:endonuclease/exonuclease/phosphatase family metal-dependent hydrolase
MRIVSYNILEGGQGRANQLAEVVRAQRPNIISLVEADELAAVEKIAGKLKMDFIHARGGKKGAAILSDWTICETIDHAAIGNFHIKSLLEATIVEPGGREWAIGVVHLHAHANDEDEKKREKQIAIVLDIFAKHRANGRPHLLVGDFNSNSPVQEIDPEKCKHSTLVEWRSNGGKIPRRVVQMILDAGYLDSLDAFDSQQAKTNGSFSTKCPGQRVDYIFAFGIDAPKIKQAWIEKSQLAEKASDHFPVGAEII